MLKLGFISLHLNPTCLLFLVSTQLLFFHHSAFSPNVSPYMYHPFICLYPIASSLPLPCSSLYPIASSLPLPCSSFHCIHQAVIFTFCSHPKFTFCLYRFLMLKLGFIPTKPSLPFVPRYLPSLSFQPRCFHLHVHVLSLHRYLHLVPAWVPPYLSSCLASLSSPGSSIPLFLPCIAIFTWFLHTSPKFTFCLHL